MIRLKRSSGLIIRVAVLLVFVFMFLNPKTVMAKTIKGTLNISACKVGKYLYYGINDGGTRDGINRLNTKNGKIEEIIHNDITGNDWTNGFRNLTVKGNYIYATWDQFAGSGGSQTYIYQIAKDGSSMKKLACGCEMVIVGNRIYYTKCKLYDDGYGGVTVTAGKASMRLDGTRKRSEKRNKFQWKSSQQYLYDLYQKEIIGVYKQGNYTYYTNSNGKKLIRESKSGIKKTIYQANGKYHITEIEVYDNYILVKVDAEVKWEDYTRIKCQVHFVKNNGRQQKLLKEWFLAE